MWEACGEDPEELELEHLPTFEVDVQRRWPSVEKARELLGWEARIDVEEGIAATVRWLRERPTARDAASAARSGRAGRRGAQPTDERRNADSSKR